MKLKSKKILSILTISCLLLQTMTMDVKKAFANEIVDKNLISVEEKAAINPSETEETSKRKTLDDTSETVCIKQEESKVEDGNKDLTKLVGQKETLENVTEESSEKADEKISGNKTEESSEKVDEKTSENKTEESSEKADEKTSENKTEESSEKVDEKTSGNKTEESSEKADEKTSENMTEEPEEQIKKEPANTMLKMTPFAFEDVITKNYKIDTKVLRNGYRGIIKVNLDLNKNPDPLKVESININIPVFTDEINDRELLRDKLFTDKKVILVRDIPENFELRKDYDDYIITNTEEISPTKLSFKLYFSYEDLESENLDIQIEINGKKATETIDLNNFDILPDKEQILISSGKLILNGESRDAHMPENYYLDIVNSYENEKPLIVYPGMEYEYQFNLKSDETPIMNLAIDNILEAPIALPCRYYLSNPPKGYQEAWDLYKNSWRGILALEKNKPDVDLVIKDGNVNTDRYVLKYRNPYKDPTTEDDGNGDRSNIYNLGRDYLNSYTPYSENTQGNIQGEDTRPYEEYLYARGEEARDYDSCYKFSQEENNIEGALIYDNDYPDLYKRSDFYDYNDVKHINRIYVNYGKFNSEYIREPETGRYIYNNESLLEEIKNLDLTLNVKKIAPKAIDNNGIYTDKGRDNTGKFVKNSILYSYFDPDDYATCGFALVYPKIQLKDIYLKINQEIKQVSKNSTNLSIDLENKTDKIGYKNVVITEDIKGANIQKEKITAQDSNGNSVDIYVANTNDGKISLTILEVEKSQKIKIDIPLVLDTDSTQISATAKVESMDGYKSDDLLKYREKLKDYEAKIDAKKVSEKLIEAADDGDAATIEEITKNPEEGGFSPKADLDKEIEDLRNQLVSTSELEIKKIENPSYTVRYEIIDTGFGMPETISSKSEVEEHKLNEKVTVKVENPFDKDITENDKKWYFFGWSTDRYKIENNAKDFVITEDTPYETVFYGTWKYIPIKDLKINTVWKDVDGKEIKNHPKDKEINLKLKKNDMSTDKKITLNKQNNWSSSFNSLEVTKEFSKEENEYTIEVEGLNKNSNIVIDDIEYKPDIKYDEKDKYNATLILTRVTPYLSVNYEILGEKPDEAQKAPIDEKRYERGDTVELMEYKKDRIETADSVKWYFEGWSTDENDFSKENIIDNSFNIVKNTVLYGRWTAVKDINVQIEWRDVDGSKKLDKIPNDKDLEIVLYKNSQTTNNKITANDKNGWKVTFIEQKLEDKDNEYSAKITGQDENEITIDDIKYSIENKKDNGNITIILTRVTPYLSVNYKILGEKPDEAQEAPQDERRYENHELVSLKQYDKNIIDTRSSEGEKLRWYFEGWSTDENDFSEKNIIKDNFKIEKDTNLYGRWQKIKLKDIKVSKIWKYNDEDLPKEKYENKSVNIQLYRNGEKVGEEKTLNKENNWTAIYKSQMEAEKAGEKPYEYTVKEIGQDQQGSIVIENVLYKVDSQMQELKEEPDKEKITIQNTRTTPLYKVKYEIIEDPRYKSPNYDFNLPTDSKSYEAGEEVKISDRIPVTQDDKNSNGEYVHWYFVGWSADKNFAKKTDKINIEKDTTIYGTWRYIRQKDIRVKKEWQDNDGGVLDNKYYEEIEVELYKNNEPTGDKRKLNAKNNWSEKFVKQLDTDENGKLNEYTVKEIGQDENDNIKLGNITYKVITKNENDNDNIKLINKRLTPFYTLSYKVIEKPEFGVPETVENMPQDLQKLNEGENITLSDIPTTKITTNKNGEKVIWKFIGWTTDKEKFDPSKKITQIQIKDNETVYGTWEYIKLNDIKVSKVWKDQDGDFLREQLYKDKNIIIELYENDENTGKTITLNSENGWSDTFKDLPEIDETSGKKNIYKVKEKGTNNDKVEIDSIEYKVNITKTEKEYTVENIRLTPYLSLNYEIVDSGFGQPETIENMPDKITKLIKGDKVEVLQTPQTKDKTDKNGQKVNWQFVGWSKDKEKFDDENIIKEKIDIQDNTTVYGTWKYIPLNNIKVKVIWKDIDKKTDLQNEKYPKDAVLELKLQKNGKEVEKQTRTVNDEKGWKEEFTGQPERESIDSEKNDYTVKITGEKNGEITVNDIKYKVNITKDGNNITIENVRITPYLRLDYETVDTGFGQPEKETIQNMPKPVTGLDKNDKVKIEKPLPQTSQQKDDKGNYVNWQFLGWSKYKDNFKAENIIKDSLIITENTKVYGTWQFIKLNNLKVKTIWKDTDGTEFKDDKYYRNSRLKVELHKNSKPTGITNILEQKNSWMNVFDMQKGTETPGGDKNDYTVSVFGLDEENHIAINNKIFEAKVEKDPEDENTIIVNMQRITPYYRLNYELVKESQTPSQYSQLPDSHTKLDFGDKVQIEGPLTTSANTNQEGQKVYWHFVGWSKDKNDFSKENIIGKELTITEDTTVYGKWEQIPKTDIKVKKIWTDKNGKILPEKFYKDNISEVELYKNSKPTGIVRKLSNDNNWNGEFDDILQKDIDSADINKFTVKESGIDENGEITINGIKYQSETKEESPNNFLIINKRITPFYKVNFEIVKDENYGIPKNITGMPNEIKMLEKGDEVSLRQIPQTTDQTDKNGKKANWYFVGWSKDKEKFDNQNIVKDIKIKDNTTVYGTWRYIGYNDLKVVTIWKDNTGEKLDSKYIKDQNIEVELYKNGEPTGKTEILNDKNNWTDVFTQLAQKDSKDKDENNYTIKVKRTDQNGQIELGDIKYQVKVEKDKDTNTFIIENTRISPYYRLRYEIVEDKNYGLPQNITQMPENIEKIDSGEILSLRQIPQTTDQTDKNKKKVNWYFVGWSKDKDNIENYNTLDEIKITENQTVYGTWRYIGYRDINVMTKWLDNEGNNLDEKYYNDNKVSVGYYEDKVEKEEVELNKENKWQKTFTIKDQKNEKEIKVKNTDEKGNIKINQEDYKVKIYKNESIYTVELTRLSDIPGSQVTTPSTGGSSGSRDRDKDDKKEKSDNKKKEDKKPEEDKKIEEDKKPEEKQKTEEVKPEEEEKSEEEEKPEEQENKPEEEISNPTTPEEAQGETQEVDANEVLGKEDTEDTKYILKDTPKTGQLELKDKSTESEIKLTKEPENGKVEVDSNGNWKYTPDKDFVGKDSFIIKYENKEGEEVEELITLDVEEPPRSAPTINFPDEQKINPKPAKLPKTGNTNSDIEIIGGLLIVAAFILKKKYKK